MAIWLVCGKQGSGKTLWCASLLYAEYLKGKKIYANIHLKFPYEQLNYDDIINCRLKNCVVYLDEAHLILGARRSMSSTSINIVDNFLSMVSKSGVELICSTQFPQKIDMRISRLEKDYAVLCEKYIWNGNNWVQTSKDAAELKDTPTIISVIIEQIFDGQILQLPPVFANNYYDIYDRYEIININGLEEATAKYKAKIALKKKIAAEDAIKEMNKQ